MLDFSNPRTFVKLGIGAVSGIAILAGVLGSFYTIDQRERGVILRNGQIVGTAQPGLNFKVPIIDDVRLISLETILTRWTKLDTYSRDQQAAKIDISVAWRTSDSSISEVYTQYHTLGGLRDRVLSPKVLEELKNIFGQYNAVTAIQERGKLNADIRDAIIKSVRGPIVIETVQIENIDFSDAYEKSVEDRMLAEVEVQKLRQNAEREKVNAEITVTKAKAEADSVRLSAQANADAIRLRGDATAQAITARAKALGENKLLVDLTSAEKWDGKLPTTMVPNGATPFVSVK